MSTQPKTQAEGLAEEWWDSLPEFDGALKGDKVISASPSAATKAFLAGFHARDAEVKALEAVVNAVTGGHHYEVVDALAKLDALRRKR